MSEGVRDCKKFGNHCSKGSSRWMWSAVSKTDTESSWLKAAHDFLNDRYGDGTQFSLPVSPQVLLTAQPTEPKTSPSIHHNNDNNWQLQHLSYQSATSPTEVCVLLWQHGSPVRWRLARLGHTDTNHLFPHREKTTRMANKWNTI